MEQLIETQDWNMVSEVELIYRSKIKASQRPKVSRSREAYELLLKHWDKDKIELMEQFKVIFLNRGHRVMGIYDISTGGITGTVADPRLIFTAALKINACELILAHNHPSGNLTPSEADKLMTSKLASAAKFLDMHVFDHIIVTPESYFSFADEGLV